jgi:hypothetical protein
MIKSRRMRLAGHIARMETNMSAYGVLAGEPKGRRPLGRLDVDGILLKMILDK